MVRDAMAGSPRAFDALVARHGGAAVGRAYAVLHNRDDAEDAAQDACMKAFRSLGSLREPERFGAWLLRIAANAARDLAARRSRRPEPLGDVVVVAPDRHADVLDAVAALSEKHQQVVYLFYMQRHSCLEIAEILGVEIGTVTSRLTRARKALHGLLSDEEDVR